MTPGEKIAFRIGIAIMLVAWIATYALTHDAGWALLVDCIVVVLLPTSVDPAILIKQAQSRPSCFGDFMWGNTYAERDCETCPHKAMCFETTAYGKGKP